MATLAPKWTRFAMTAALAAATACSGGDGRDLAPVRPGAGASGPEPPAVDLTVSDAAGACTVTVAGSTAPGVSSVRVTNDGAQRHAVQLVRAVDDHSGDEVGPQLAPGGTMAEWLTPVGGVATVEPGRTGEAELDLDVGRYWVMCASSPAGPDSPDPVTELAVDPSGPAALAEGSEPDATLTATDGAFTAIGIRPGAQRLQFRNDGRQPHHAVLTPIVPGRDFAAASAAVRGTGDRAAIDSGRAVTVPVVGPGLAVTVSIDVPAGEYLLACFLPDRGAAAPRHVDEGMLAHVVVA